MLDDLFQGRMEMEFESDLKAKSFELVQTLGEQERVVSGRVFEDHVELLRDGIGAKEEYRFELKGPLMVVDEHFPETWGVGLSRFDLTSSSPFPLQLLLVSQSRLLRVQVQVLEERTGRTVEFRSGGKAWYRLRLDMSGKLKRFEDLSEGLIATIEPRAGEEGTLFEE